MNTGGVCDLRVAAGGCSQRPFSLAIVDVVRTRALGGLVQDTRRAVRLGTHKTAVQESPLGHPGVTSG